MPNSVRALFYFDDYQTVTVHSLQCAFSRADEQTIDLHRGYLITINTDGGHVQYSQLPVYVDDDKSFYVNWDVQVEREGYYNGKKNYTDWASGYQKYESPDEFDYNIQITSLPFRDKRDNNKVLGKFIFSIIEREEHFTGTALDSYLNAIKYIIERYPEWHHNAIENDIQKFPFKIMNDSLGNDITVQFGVRNFIPTARVFNPAYLIGVSCIGELERLKALYYDILQPTIRLLQYEINRINNLFVP